MAPTFEGIPVTPRVHAVLQCGQQIERDAMAAAVRLDAAYDAIKPSDCDGWPDWAWALEAANVEPADEMARDLCRAEDRTIAAADRRLIVPACDLDPGDFEQPLVDAIAAACAEVARDYLAAVAPALALFPVPVKEVA